MSVKLTKGREPGRTDEVAVGRRVLGQLGAEVGDRITATAPGAVELTIVSDNLDPGVDVAGQGFAMTHDGLAQLVHATINGIVVRSLRAATTPSSSTDTRLSD